MGNSVRYLEDAELDGAVDDLELKRELEEDVVDLEKRQQHHHATKLPPHHNSTTTTPPYHHNIGEAKRRHASRLARDGEVA